MNSLAREPQLCWQNWILDFKAGHFLRSPRGVDRIVAHGFCALHCLKLAALLSALFMCSNSAVFGNLPQALYTVSWEAGYTIVTVQSTRLTVVPLRITEAVQRKILPLMVHDPTNGPIHMAATVVESDGFHTSRVSCRPASRRQTVANEVMQLECKHARNSVKPWVC